jgi:hypothetical protein
VGLLTPPHASHLQHIPSGKRHAIAPPLYANILIKNIVWVSAKATMLATAAMGGGDNRFAGLTSHSLVYLMEVWKVLHTQVPQRLNDLFFPTRKPLKIPLHTLFLSETLLLQVINTTHQLLHHTNPTLAHGCWVCQWTGPSQVIASPINISTPLP